MSEPMSSVEIEDVLSSIRRLVSDELRPMPRANAASRTPMPGDKLILTPALRVVGSAAAGVPEPALEISEPTDPETHRPDAQFFRHVNSPAMPPVVVALPTDSSGLEVVIASLELAVEAQAQTFESETGDEAPQTDAGWQAQSWSRAPASEVLERVDFAEDQDPAVAENRAVPLEPSPGWAQEGPLDSDVAEAPFVEAESAPESAVDSSDVEWLDRAEAEVVASLADDAPLSGFATATDATTDAFYDEPELRFDETVLRDLVRDLIREELQGGLGERITRNVRKLVRAEIARVLATSEFDAP